MLDFCALFSYFLYFVFVAAPLLQNKLTLTVFVTMLLLT